MYYVQIEACLMWIAVQTGSPFGSLGSLRSLASVHVESTCEISSILSLVPDSPNHPTCLPDRARRLPDMSPIRHQASLANSMHIYVYIYIYIWWFLICLVIRKTVTTASTRTLENTCTDASEQSEPSERNGEPVWTAVHIRHAKICTSYMLKSAHKAC